MSPDEPAPPGGTAADHMRQALAVLATPARPQASTYVSDLLVGELVLLDEVGYEPVDLVAGAGSASWNPQIASGPGGSDAWASAITSAISTARSAIDREIRERSADGVVAVQLHMDRHPANVLTCTLLGTAIRRRAASRGASDHGPRRPFGTTLSARDFHLLVRAGYLPVGIVTGVAVVAFAARSLTQGLGLSRENRELTDQTAALYRAREIAMGRLDAEARAYDASGVVDVSFSEHPFNSVLVHAVELLAIGTAIRRGPDGHRPILPHLQLALDDPPPGVFTHG
ncbi:MAG: heavy metal-binding domain-containing protein [Actinomycetota bacterium]|nr:heavy metal-binding domain-containing protein [Actinomycetota bacterium]MDA8280055.1 heavy metal-binding domain-containing protein [Actinomycetota bacterium]